MKIGDAARLLGVSIDTIRRWEKKGKVTAERLDGKNRYFAKEEIVKCKKNRPLTISQVAKRFKLSPITLRRLEEKGYISPKRNRNGVRIYDESCIGNFVMSDYFKNRADFIARSNKVTGVINKVKKTVKKNKQQNVKDGKHELPNFKKEVKQKKSGFFVSKRIFKSLRNYLFSLLICLLSLTGVYFFGGLELKEVEADTSTITHRSDFSLGKTDGTQWYSNEGDLKLNTAGTWGPRTWHAETRLSLGTAIASDGDYVYVLTGRDKFFQRYIPNENRWEDLATPLHSTDYGASLTVLDGYIYAIFGGYTNSFSRYSISDNSWEDLSDTPDLVYAGGSLATDGTNIYALRGYNTTEFWKYFVGTDSWTVSDSTPASMYHGATLTYNDGFLYATRGNNQKKLYRYSISGNVWDTMTDSPVNFYDVTNATIKDDHIYILQDRNTDTFYRYDIDDNNWDTLTTTPQYTRYVGVVYNSSEDLIYVFRGNNYWDFWKYDADTGVGGTFLGPEELPNTPGSGSDLVYYNGYLYYPRGGNQANFYRYSVAGDSWETMTSSDQGFNDDTKGVAAGTYLYFFRGSGNDTFYRYTPGGSWTTMEDAPATIGYGGTLVYPGSGDYIYATRGYYTGSFYRYSISGDSWDDGVVADLPDNAEASYGARLLYNGTDIYYLSGARTGVMLKYVIATNTWSEVTELPYAPYWGTDATYYNGDIYIQSGFYKKDCWAYNIASDTWRYLEPLNQYYETERGPYNGGSMESDGTGQIFSTTGQGFTYLSLYTANANNYLASGTWTSDFIDLTYVNSWTSLNSSKTTPGDSSVSFETRSSTDLATWSDWEVVSGTTIASPERRYLQIRATLSSTTDRSQGPTLHDITITYAGDENDPTNPTVFSGYSQQVGGSSLTDGSTYKYAHPYFSWTGASDTESAIAGYYVYFGTNASADPETDGSYQTTVGYEVTETLSANTYYLRLKTKDSADNISSAVTGFTYVYSGVPAQSVSVTTTAQFNEGSADSINSADDELKLEGKSGFWLQEQLSVAPANINYGADFAYDSSSSKLYTFRGSNTTTFYEYDIDSDTWSSLDTAPASVHYGGAVIEGPSGYLFGLRGYNTTSFWRYDIENDLWSDEDATDVPQSTYYGASMVYDGSQYIYLLKGYNDDAFLRYDTSEDSWSSMDSVDFGAPTNQVNNYVGYGGDLAYDGNNTIYAIQGNTRTGISAYSISENSWTMIENTPHAVYQGGQLEYDSSTNALYLIPGWGKPYFYKYSINTGEWSELNEGPYTFGNGTSIRNVDGKLFVLRGNNSTYFYTYDIEDNSWLIPTRNLFGGTYFGSTVRYFNYGADLVKGEGNYYYLTRGNYDNMFIRYDSSTGATVELAGLPTGQYVGGALTYDEDNHKVYAIASQQNSYFYSYDVNTNVWNNIDTDPLPSDPSEGASLEYDGSRYVYYNRGGNTTSFYRYDTQGSAGNRWDTTLTSAPATLRYGAELVYKDGYIYTLRGNNTNPNPLYRYDPGGDSWYTGLDSMPIDVYNDGFIVDGGGNYLYGCKAENTPYCYRYSISGDSWESIDDAPANIYYAAAAASDGSAKIFVIAGPGTNTFNDGLYTYIMETDTSSFEEEGTYNSKTHDLTSVYRWANLAVNYTSATNNTLTAYTRTSANGTDWDDWTLSSEKGSFGTSYLYKINSTEARYIQVKFELESGDGIYSGIISDYSVNYYQDTDEPTNPTSLTSYSNSGMGTEITTNTWYAHTAPHFDWPDAEAAGGATDTATGSGVIGYYVYFGTNALADPEVLGESVSVSEYTASSLVSGSTYYLRIKTVDDAGNVSSTSWQPFTYKFDSSAPSQPENLEADPSGYTLTDAFDFTWDPAIDGQSEVASYCYKTGASSGPYSTDTCAVGTSVSDVPSYQSGANTFYVRSKDTAGNYSEYTTVSFYYSSGPPSEPTSLLVDPVENTENSFSFSWSAPSAYFGSVANLTYYYSINALPTASSTTSTTGTSLAADAYATLPGENTFYVVAKDEAGNIDWDEYASITFTANTSAPGAPTQADIADVSVKATESWKIAVSWEIPSSLGSGVASYKVFRSTDNSTFSEIASTSGISYVDTGLSQLTYYYKVKACDSANNCGAFSDTVSQYPDGKFTEAAPLVSEPVVSGITTSQAIVSWTTSRTCDSKIAFGTSSDDYNDEEVSSSEHVTSHQLALTNLSPGTGYYFIAKWTDEDGNTGISEEYEFETEPPPSSKEISAIDIGLTTVTIQFTSQDGAKAKIYYGKSTDFGGSKETSIGATESTYTVQLTGLEDGTKYYFKVNLFDTEDEEYEGDIYSFETLPRPAVTDVKVSQVQGTATPTLYITWNSNTEISSIVTYYPQGNQAASQDSVDVALTTGKHRALLEKLVPNTNYVILVSGRDVIGNEARSEEIVFTTAFDTRPPLITDVKVEGSVLSAGASQEEKIAQLVVTWTTDEPATSQVEYGEGSGTTYSQKTQEDSNFGFNHLVVISNLTPSKVYHLRSVSKDEAGNETKSIDTVTITPKVTESAIDLVIANLSQVFGFLGNIE